MRGASTRKRVVIDRSLPVTASRVYFLPAVATAIFVFFALEMTSAITVDCTRVSKNEGACTFVEHTFVRKKQTRATIAELATVRLVDRGDDVGIVGGGYSRDLLTTESEFAHEKRGLVERLHAFAQEETPTMRLAYGRWWLVDRDVVLLVVAGFAAGIVVWRRGKLRVVIDPREDVLAMETNRWGIVPIRATLPLSTVHVVRVEVMDAEASKCRLRIGEDPCCLSGPISPEDARAAATEIHLALVASEEKV